MVSPLPATATVIGLVVLAQVPTTVEAAGVALSIPRWSCGGRARSYDGAGVVSATPGLFVSRVCLGMMSFASGAPGRSWMLDEAAASRTARAAVEGGITFFDTADVPNIARSSPPAAAEAPSSRDELVLATKVHGQSDARPDRPRPVAQAHPVRDRRLPRAPRHGLCRPLPDPPLDRHAPIEETMDALNDVVRAGKARYIGASSMYAW